MFDSDNNFIHIKCLNILFHHKILTQQVHILTVSNDRSKPRDTHKLINLSLSDGIL